MLAAEDRVGLGHQRLDVRMADAGAHGRAAALVDQLGHRARGDQVVDDGRAGLTGQLTIGDQRRHRRRRHGVALLVDDEAAVGVAVERQAYISTVGDDLPLQIHQVGRVQRVGLVVGERAVELEVQRQQGDRPHGAQHSRRGVPAHAVSGVDRDPQWTQRRHIDQRTQEGAVLGEHVALLDRAGGAVVAGHAVDDLIADVGQTGFLADGLRARPAQLDAVVGGRVVAGGEHGARAVEETRGEVELIGRRQPDPDHVQTLRGDPLGERRGQ